MIQVEDLKPRGVLHHACITAPAEGEEFQEQLPEAVRRQYLHELFPDLSLEANFQNEPDHQELSVPREELVDHLHAGHSSFQIDYTRGLNVIFKDELGRGSGVMKEWLGLLAKHHFGKHAGVFQPCPTDPATVHPIRSPGREFDWEDGPHYMRNAGRFAGLALCYRCPIGIKLSTACLKVMTGRKVSLADFEHVEPQVYRTIQAIQAASTEEEIQSMGLTFETPKGAAFEPQGDEPVGAAVTLHNKQHFLDCLFHHFLDCSEEVSHFLEGLCSMSDWNSWHDKYSGETARDSKNMLRPLAIDDFSRHLAGKLAPLNVAEWRAATTIRSSFACPGAYQDFDWFWEMVHGMDEQRRRQLLSFWTSMSTLPAGGFAELSSKLKLQSSPQTQALPTAHTCFFQLNLPHYKSLEELTAAFTTALNESQGFAFG